MVRYVALAVLFLIAAGFEAQHSREVMRRVLQPERVAQIPFTTGLFGGSVTRVFPEAEAAGLRQGDRVLTLEGNAYHGRQQLARRLRGASPRESLTAVVETPGQAERAAVMTLSGGSRPQLLNIAVSLALVVFTPAACLLLGFGVTALRPYDRRAWFLLVMMLGFARRVSGMEPDQVACSHGLGPVAGIYGELAGAAWPIGMLLFGLYFSPPARSSRWRGAFAWVLAAPLGAFGLAKAAVAGAASEGLIGFAPLHELLLRVQVVAIVMNVLAALAFFASLGYQSRNAPSPDDRRRLRLILAGARVSLGPAFFFVLASLIVRGTPFALFDHWLAIPAVLPLALFPLTLAYVIAVRQALDVQVVVRQGLQYALARRGVRVAQIVVSFLVVLVAVSLAADPHANRPRRIQYIAFGMALVFLMNVGAERLGRWVDRRFFREAYDAERVLTELGQSVRTLVNTGVLLTTVAQRVSETLHISRVAAYLKEDGRYRPAHALGVVEPPVLAESSLIQRLQDGRRPVRILPEETPADGAVFGVLDPRLLLPLAVNDRLLGFLVLGEKLSEAPYSAADLRLLESVAAQTALALENSQLTAAVARETALRAGQDRELEIAREVQQRLFPQRWPAVPGLRYAGHCRPALAVGGDYFDFVEIGGELGMAVGDVSGKGIAAALLMACLQASLRSQALGAPGDLITLMARLNAYLYEASPSNRYATLFYAQYEPRSRRLHYVNAGHNRPMVLRGDGTVLRLSEGGLVVGLLPAVEYEQGTLTLGPGDVLVGFTDGVSEAMNAHDEEWGEERLLQVVRAAALLEPPQIVQNVLAAADAFVAGAPQHDDMTLLVLQVV